MSNVTLVVEAAEPRSPSTSASILMQRYANECKELLGSSGQYDEALQPAAVD
jgi:hypothetical protein